MDLKANVKGQESPCKTWSMNWFTQKENPYALTSEHLCRKGPEQKQS